MPAGGGREEGREELRRWEGGNLGGRREEMKKIKQKNRGSGVAGSLAGVQLGGREYFGAITKS